MNKIANLEIGEFKVEMGKINSYIVRIYQKHNKIIEVTCQSRKSAKKEFSKAAKEIISTGQYSKE